MFKFCKVVYLYSILLLAFKNVFIDRRKLYMKSVHNPGL